MRTGRFSRHAASAMKGCTDEVELGAETAADRSRQYSHLLGRDPQNLGDAVAIQIGRLGAGLDFDAVPHAPGKTGLRFDISVLDKTRLKNSVDDDVAVFQTDFDVAAHDPADGEHVVGAMRMEARRAGAQRLIDGFQRRQRGEDDREIAEVERGHRFILADDERHRVAAEERDGSPPAPAGRRRRESRQTG